MSIFERIKLAREEVGISQGELSRILGVSRSAISNWESNSGLKTSMSAENLIKCASILNVSPIWLIFGKESGENYNNLSKKIPVLNPEDIQAWINIPVIKKNGEFIVTNGNINEGAFAIKLKGCCFIDSKDPSKNIYDGDQVVVEPRNKEDINNNDLLLVKFGEGDHRPRMFIQDGKDIFLKGSDDTFPVVSLDESKHEILGVIILITRILKDVGMLGCNIPYMI